jgi:WD40 repeat protein
MWKRAKCARSIECTLVSTRVLFDANARTGAVNAVAFNEESSVVFSACLDGCVRAWDVRARDCNQPVQTMDEATDSVLTVCVSDSEIVSGSADNRVRRYDLRAGKLHVDFVGGACARRSVAPRVMGHTGPATCVSFTRDGQGVLVSTMDGNVRLFDHCWHTASLFIIFQNCIIMHTIRIAFLLLHTPTVEGSTKTMAKCWHSTCVRTLSVHHPFIHCRFTGAHKNTKYKCESVTATGDAFVLTGSEDGRVVCYELLSGRAAHTLRHPNSIVVHSLSAHPTKQQLVTASGSYAFLWSTPSEAE